MPKHTDVQKAETQGKPNVKVRYETTGVVYVSQFLLNATPEEILVNCSSGYISDPVSNEHILPIQLRMVMTSGAAQRLYDSLGQALKQASNGKGSPSH